MHSYFGDQDFAFYFPLLYLVEAEECPALVQLQAVLGRPIHICAFIIWAFIAARHVTNDREHRAMHHMIIAAVIAQLVRDV